MFFKKGINTHTHPITPPPRPIRRFFTKLRYLEMSYTLYEVRVVSTNYEVTVVSGSPSALIRGRPPPSAVEDTWSLGAYRWCELDLPFCVCAALPVVASHALSHMVFGGFCQLTAFLWIDRNTVYKLHEQQLRIGEDGEALWWQSRDWHSCDWLPPLK